MVNVVSAGTKIKDVPKSSGTYKAVQKSVDLGYLSLQSNGKFNPNATVTRQEMAVILDKLVKSTEDNLDTKAFSIFILD